MVYEFALPPAQLEELQKKYWNQGKNSHIGDFAVEIAKLYFQSQDEEAICTIVKDGTDLEVCCKGAITRYEVKGTTDDDVAYQKLKVSSQASYDALVGGTTLVRVTSVGKAKVRLHFLQFGTDFDLIEEARWAVRPLTRKRRPAKP